MKKSDKAYEVKIDENREIRGKDVDGRILYRIVNGRAITHIQLTMEAVCAMFQIMRKIEVEKEAELSNKASSCAACALFSTTMPGAVAGMTHAADAFRFDSMSMTLNPVPQTGAFAEIHAEYMAAKTKHPFFAHRAMGVIPLDIAENHLECERHALNRAIQDGRLSGRRVLECEITEAQEAYSRHDYAHCRQELAQCAAVIVRMMEKLAEDEATWRMTKP